MEIEEGTIMRFRFRSPNMKESLAHYVLTQDPEKMKMFLIQHNFDPTAAVIEYLPSEKHESDESCMLDTFMLKSNYSDKTYKIVSTEEMMWHCSEEIASIMSSSLVLGPAIIREEIPIFDIIADLISQLDHVYVLDKTICDPNTKKPYADKYEQICAVEDVSYVHPEHDKIWMQAYGEPASYDDSSIYESFAESCEKDRPMPFTLEMYVSYFAGLLTDSYD